MKRIVTIIGVILCVFLAVILEPRAESQSSGVNESNRKIVVEIDYGNVQPSRMVEIPLTTGKTVLEVLQTVATVETHPVNQYVFVAAIDGVEGKRGEMAWYYTVDGKSPDKLAYSKVLDGTEGVVKWTYKKDVCSWKVDGGSNPTKEDGD